jgi:hypothetical protein
MEQRFWISKTTEALGTVLPADGGNLPIKEQFRRCITYLTHLQEQLQHIINERNKYRTRPVPSAVGACFSLGGTAPGKTGTAVPAMPAVLKRTRPLSEAVAEG